MFRLTFALHRSSPRRFPVSRSNIQNRSVPQRHFAQEPILGKPSWSVKDLLQGKGDEQVNDAQIDHLLSLTRFDATLEDRSKLEKDIKQMMVFVGHINDVNTEGIEPLYSLVEDIPISLREDEAGKRLTPEEILANAKETHRGYFVAPKSKQDEEEE